MANTLKLFLIFFIATPLMGSPSHFRGTKSRYIGGHDLFRVFIQKFPQTACLSYERLSRASLGDLNPANGKPTYPTISPAFVRWYINCLYPVIEKLGVDSEFLLSLGFDPKDKDEPWNKIDSTQREKVANALIRRYLERPARKDLVQELASENDLTASEAITQNILHIVLEDDFLTY